MKMTKKFKYSSVLIFGPQKGIFIEFPFDCYAEFGSRKSIRIKLKVEGRTYARSLLPQGNGRHWIQLRKDICSEIGKGEGDTVSVSVEKDDSPRTIAIPEYLQWLLDDEPEMKVAFQKLSFFNKNFWIKGIEETKNEETKIERINRLFDFLRSDVKSGY
jgi:hypothetical protein